MSERVEGSADEPVVYLDGKYVVTVPLYKVAWAHLRVPVDVQEVRENWAADPEEPLTEESLKEYAIEQAHAHAPTICAQCSGWGSERYGDISFSLELGDDEWSSEDEPLHMENRDDGIRIKPAD